MTDNNKINVNIVYTETLDKQDDLLDAVVWGERSLRFINLVFALPEEEKACIAELKKLLRIFSKIDEAPDEEFQAVCEGDLDPVINKLDNMLEHGQGGSLYIQMQLEILLTFIEYANNEGWDVEETINKWIEALS